MQLPPIFEAEGRARICEPVLIVGVTRIQYPVSTSCGNSERACKLPLPCLRGFTLLPGLNYQNIGNLGKSMIGTETRAMWPSKRSPPEWRSPHFRQNQLGAVVQGVAKEAVDRDEQLPATPQAMTSVFAQDVASSRKIRLELNGRIVLC